MVGCLAVTEVYLLAETGEEAATFGHLLGLKHLKLKEIVTKI